MCGLFWGAHKSLAPRARPLLGGLGQATLSFLAVATLLFVFFCECPKFCDLAKQRRKSFGGVSEVGKDDFSLYFFWRCVVFLVLYFSSAVIARRLRAICPSTLKGTHRRVHRHYQCKDLTSTAVWAAAYQEDPRTRHIYEVAVRSPAARHQLRDAKLSFDNGKFFHLSTTGKRVLVPRTLVTLIVAMYHELRFYGHPGVL